MLIGCVCGADTFVVVAILGRRGQKTVSRCGALVFGVGTGPKFFLKNKNFKKRTFYFKKKLKLPVHDKCDAHEQEKNDSEEDANDDPNSAAGVSAVVVDGVG